VPPARDLPRSLDHGVEGAEAFAVRIESEVFRALPDNGAGTVLAVVDTERAS
jgi:hypothetical protein